MKSANKALLVVVLLFLVGAWGCSQNAGNAPGTGAARIRDLESRNAKMEEDYRLALSSRDQARQRAVALEEAQAQRQEELNNLAKERDELRKQIALRVTERDGLQANLLQLGKDLQNLAGRIDAAINTTTQPATPATTTTAAPIPEPAETKS